MPADQRRTARLAVLLLAFAVVLVVCWWVAQGSDGQLGGQLDGRAGVGTSASATESAPRSTQDTPHPATKDTSGHYRSFTVTLSKGMVSNRMVSNSMVSNSMVSSTIGGADP
jgi:hypothetical protein